MNTGICERHRELLPVAKPGERCIVEFAESLGRLLKHAQVFTAPAFCGEGAQVVIHLQDETSVEAIAVGLRELKAIVPQLANLLESTEE